MKKYDAKHFINKFSAIPDDRWTTRVYQNQVTGQCCTLGHCGVTNENAGNDSEEVDALKDLFIKFDFMISEINDGRDEETRMLGNTPKERILNALVLADSGILDEV